MASVSQSVTTEPPPLQVLPVQNNSCSSRLKEVVEIIVQVSIRAIYIFSNILIASYLFPISWHWIAIPLVATSSTFLAAFFYPHCRSLIPSVYRWKNSLTRPFRLPSDGTIPENYPVGSPIGYANLGNVQCAFNATAHFFDSDPQIAAWLRHPIRDNTDLPTFLQFLGDYFPPPALVENFLGHEARTAAPKPDVLTLFLQFLNTFNPSAEDRVETDRIKDTFKNLSLVHPVLSNFYDQNDLSIRDRRAVSSGDSRTLREALSGITSSIQPGQVDAKDIAGVILCSLIPETMKAHVQSEIHFNLQDLPPMGNPPIPKREKIGLFPLDLCINEQASDLNTLIQRSFNYGNVEPLKVLDVDGVERPYPIDHVTVGFLERPPALRFLLKRVVTVPPADAGGNWMERYLQIPVECPENIEIRLVNGEVHRYRLTSYVTHIGADNDGHYISGEIRDGEKYLENDSFASLVETPEDLADWNDQLRQAYLLCYVPVEELPVAVQD